MADREKYFYTQKNAFEIIDNDEASLSDAYCEKYKKFIAEAKTERESGKIRRCSRRGRGFYGISQRHVGKGRR